MLGQPEAAKTFAKAKILYGKFGWLPDSLR
jgi:hypothetical protein